MRRFILPLFVLMWLPSTGHAGLVIDASFGTGFASTFTPDDGPLGSISGSFTVEFDDSAVTGSGSETFSDLDIVTALSLNPNPFPSTSGITFEADNVLATVAFFNGALSGVSVGGGTSALNMDFNGDWGVTVNDNGTVPFAYRSLGGDFYTNTCADGCTQGQGGFETRPRGTTTVPAPNALALLGLGLAGLFGTRRKRA